MSTMRPKPALLLSLSLFSLMCASQLPSVLAALPPLSNEQRAQSANTILETRVLSVTSRIVNTPYGSNENFTASVRVLKVRKGTDVQVGQTVVVRYWLIHERTQGWVGPSGQYDPPQVGEHRLMYLQRVGNHTFSLLQPNGSDKLPESSTGHNVGHKSTA